MTFQARCDRASCSRPAGTAQLGEQADAHPVAIRGVCRQPTPACGPATWAVEKAGHVARSAIWHVEQATVVPGIAEHAAVVRRSAEHSDTVAVSSTVVAAIALFGYLEQAGVPLPLSVTRHIDLPYRDRPLPACQD